MKDWPINNHEIMEEIWNETSIFREQTEDYKDIVWQKHTNPFTGEFLETNELFMMGIILYQKKKRLAEFHITWDKENNTSRLFCMKKGHKEKEISLRQDLSSNPRNNIKKTMSDLGNIVCQLKKMLDNGNIKDEFPKEWEGKSMSIMSFIYEQITIHPKNTFKIIFYQFLIILILVLVLFI